MRQMDEAVQLFAEKVIKAGIIDAAKANQIRHDCENTSDIIVFGEALLKDSPGDFEQVQELLNEAVEEFNQGGRATNNPFKTNLSPKPSEPQQIKPQTQDVVSVNEPTNQNLSDRWKRPPEKVVSAAGVAPGIPDFASLNYKNKEQVAAALIGMLLSLGEAEFSDLHISGGSRPFGRRFGKLEYLTPQPIDESLAEAFGMVLLSSAQIAFFKKFQDFDFAIALDNGHRYRTNLMQHRDGIKITFRLVPEKILTLEELGFGPHIETIKKMLAYHNGLILVTGPVGCGKTTTLAAMVNELNNTRTDHIICVEDPIEIVHRSNKCSVTQRGVGPHTHSFKSALKGALRQDPDIIVIGEMRDLQTIEMAISASETGHLVIGTMHTSDAAMTLNRILDVFPPSAQAQIRAMVSESLRGIVCQRLLPSTKGHSVLACEILVKNLAVSALIREGKQAGLNNIMETGKKDGMIQMDACVLQTYQNGLISAETAKANIQNEIIRRNII